MSFPDQVRQSGVNLRPPIIPLHHPLEELTEIREPKFKIDWIFVVVFSPFMGLLLGTLCYNVTGYYDGFGSFISLLATLSFGLLALGFWFVAIQKPHEVVFENRPIPTRAFVYLIVFILIALYSWSVFCASVNKSA